MMHRRNKTIPIVLMVLCILLLSSCTEEADTGESTSADQQTQDSEEEAADESSETEEEPALSHAEWYGDALMPKADTIASQKLPVKAKGIYLTGWTAGGDRFNDMLNLVNETELNAMVIDVKEDEGKVTYRSEVPLVNKIGADSTTMIRDIDQVLQTVKQNNIYSIARVVTFKDPYLAAKKPEWAMHRNDGSVWYDPSGVSWVDPYRKEVWEYAVSVAKEAARKGFDEIQFDYVRFPANGKKIDREVDFHNPNDWSKAKNISEFLKYADKELDPYNVYVSADIFGLVPSVSDDMQIGQKWEMMSPYVDFASPMMYPSHYANHTYGLPVPDAQPYETIRQGLLDAQEKDESIRERGEKPAIIRPWYQDFTATWVQGYVPYGPKEVLAQIRAGKELGVDQYLIWDSKNTYSEEAWRNPESYR